MKIVDTLMQRIPEPVAHRSHWLYLAIMVPIAVSNFMPPTGVWGAVSVPLVLAYILVFMINAQHSMRLCETCCVEFRIDAAEHSAKHHRQFALAHRLNPLMFKAALVALVSIVLVGRPWSAVIQLVYIATITALVFLNRFHGRYQLWCPYCRRPRGDGDDKEEAPDPTPGHGRPLPVT
ncbi:hypothetical protein [Streptomyces sp. NPDC059761]|uniref:hypothetical protein n=1 Tax=Streptomyces sp. NPDC059761 TaxID=3346937 RepID=UPI00366893E4